MPLPQMVPPPNIFLTLPFPFSILKKIKIVKLYIYKFPWVFGKSSLKTESDIFIISSIKYKLLSSYATKRA